MSSFICLNCNTQFSKESLFKIHTMMNICVLYKSPSDLSQPQNQFDCVKCGKSFSKECYLKIHKYCNTPACKKYKRNKSGKDNLKGVKDRARKRKSAPLSSQNFVSCTQVKMPLRKNAVRRRTLHNIPTVMPLSSLNAKDNTPVCKRYKRNKFDKDNLRDAKDRARKRKSVPLSPQNSVSCTEVKTSLRKNTVQRRKTLHNIPKVYMPLSSLNAKNNTPLCKKYRKNNLKDAKDRARKRKSAPLSSQNSILCTKVKTALKKYSVRRRTLCDATRFEVSLYLNAKSNENNNPNRSKKINKRFKYSLRKMQVDAFSSSLRSNSKGIEAKTRNRINAPLTFQNSVSCTEIRTPQRKNVLSERMLHSITGDVSLSPVNVKNSEICDPNRYEIINKDMTYNLRKIKTSPKDRIATPLWNSVSDISVKTPKRKNVLRRRTLCNITSGDNESLSPIYVKSNDSNKSRLSSPVETSFACKMCRKSFNKEYLLKIHEIFSISTCLNDEMKTCAMQLGNCNDQNDSSSENKNQILYMQSTSPRRENNTIRTSVTYSGHHSPSTNWVNSVNNDMLPSPSTNRLNSVNNDMQPSPSTNHVNADDVQHSLSIKQANFMSLTNNMILEEDLCKNNNPQCSMSLTTDMIVEAGLCDNNHPQPLQVHQVDSLDETNTTEASMHIFNDCTLLIASEVKSNDCDDLKHQYPQHFNDMVAEAGLRENTNSEHSTSFTTDAIVDIDICDNNDPLQSRSSTNDIIVEADLRDHNNSQQIISLTNKVIEEDDLFSPPNDHKLLLVNEMEIFDKTNATEVLTHNYNDCTLSIASEITVIPNDCDDLVNQYKTIIECPDSKTVKCNIVKECSSFSSDIKKELAPIPLPLAESQNEQPETQIENVFSCIVEGKNDQLCTNGTNHGRSILPLSNEVDAETSLCDPQNHTLSQCEDVEIISEINRKQFLIYSREDDSTLTIPCEVTMEYSQNRNSTLQKEIYIRSDDITDYSTLPSMTRLNTEKGNKNNQLINTETTSQIGNNNHISLQSRRTDSLSGIEINKLLLCSNEDDTTLAAACEAILGTDVGDDIIKDSQSKSFCTNDGNSSNSFLPSPTVLNTGTNSCNNNQIINEPSSIKNKASAADVFSKKQLLLYSPQIYLQPVYHYNACENIQCLESVIKDSKSFKKNISYRFYSELLKYGKTCTAAATDKVAKSSPRTSFKCLSCNKYFTRQYNLNNHLKKTRTDIPSVCLICKKAFSEKCSYMMHMKMHHKRFADGKKTSALYDRKSLAGRVHITATITPALPNMA